MGLGLARRTPAEPPPQVVWDMAEGDHNGWVVHDAAAAGQLGPLEELLARLGPDWEYRDLLVSVAAAAVRSAWVDAWTNGKPNSDAAWLVRGAVELHRAWSHRSERMNNETPAQHEAQVLREFEAAERSLQRAASLNPADPTPYRMLMGCARGRDLGREEVEARYAELRRRDPFHRMGAWEMLLALQPGWFGSPAAMLHHARVLHRTAPAGHPVHTILATAHVRRWTDLVATVGAERAARYWTLTEVQRDVDAAHAAYLGSPFYRLWPRELRSRNAFAFCFWKLERPSRARQEFDRIGPYANSDPWAAEEGGAEYAFLLARYQCYNH